MCKYVKGVGDGCGGFEVLRTWGCSWKDWYRVLILHCLNSSLIWTNFHLRLCSYELLWNRWTSKWYKKTYESRYPFPWGKSLKRTWAKIQMFQLVLVCHVAQSCRFPYLPYQILGCDSTAPGSAYKAAMGWAPVTVAPAALASSGRLVQQHSLVFEKLGE